MISFVFKLHLTCKSVISILSLVCLQIGSQRYFLSCLVRMLPMRIFNNKEKNEVLSYRAILHFTDLIVRGT